MEAKMKTCADCLCCKVSAKSTESKRLCFCSESKKKTLHPEKYWLAKKTCGEFEDMGEKPVSFLIIKAGVTMPENKRKPLLRNKVCI